MMGVPHAASTTAVLRSMAAVEVEDAPNALVLGLTTPFSSPATTQASVASLATTPDPVDSAAVGGSGFGSDGDVGFGTSPSGQPPPGAIPPACVVAAPHSRPAVAPHARPVVTATLSTMPGIFPLSCSISHS
ncbi:unnamed protein product [Phytophthora fragariaefolia]|uniref:Unnamed protein product n=1 Tax=Phytophthora fragariaefolia TaxID=1490495 RepID=A0A9W6XG30_9STRA|nr:unnamed protein product [Phytophthora fragariaefolia]